MWGPSGVHPREPVWGSPPQSARSPPPPAAAAGPHTQAEALHAAAAAFSAPPPPDDDPLPARSPTAVPQGTQPPSPAGFRQASVATAQPQRAGTPSPQQQLRPLAVSSPCSAAERLPMPPVLQEAARVGLVPDGYRLASPALPVAAAVSGSSPARSISLQPSAPRQPDPYRRGAGTRAVLALMGFCCMLGLSGMALLITWGSRDKHHDGPCSGACEAVEGDELWRCVRGDGCCEAMEFQGKEFASSCTERGDTLLIAGLLLMGALILTTLAIWLGYWWRQQSAAQSPAEDAAIAAPELGAPPPAQSPAPAAPAAAAQLPRAVADRTPAAAGTKTVAIALQGHRVQCCVARGIPEADAELAAKRLLGVQPEARAVWLSPQLCPVRLTHDSVEDGVEYQCVVTGAAAPLAVRCPEAPADAAGIYFAAQGRDAGGMPRWESPSGWRLAATAGGSWALQQVAGGAAHPQVESAPHRGRLPQELDLPGLWQRFTPEGWVPCKGFECTVCYDLWEALEVDLGQGRWVPCFVTGVGWADGKVQYRLRIAETERHNRAEGLAGTELKFPVTDPGEDGTRVLRAPQTAWHEGQAAAQVRQDIVSPKKPPEPSFSVKTVSLLPADVATEAAVAARGSAASSLVTVASGVPEAELANGVRQRLGIAAGRQLALFARDGRAVRLHHDDLVDGSTYYFRVISDGGAPLASGAEVEVPGVAGGSAVRGTVTATLPDGRVAVRLHGGGERVVPRDLCRPTVEHASPRRTVSTPQRAPAPESEPSLEVAAPPVLLSATARGAEAPPASVQRSGGGSPRGSQRVSGGPSAVLSPGRAAALQLRRSLLGQSARPPSASTGPKPQGYDDDDDGDSAGGVLLQEIPQAVQTRAVVAASPPGRCAAALGGHSLGATAVSVHVPGGRSAARSRDADSEALDKVAELLRGMQQRHTPHTSVASGDPLDAPSGSASSTGGTPQRPSSARRTTRRSSRSSAPRSAPCDAPSPPQAVLPSRTRSTGPAAPSPGRRLGDEVQDLLQRIASHTARRSSGADAGA
eukprot:TRINITY_DN70244_c0_g1_i1.p1 TRINITY_DN70244_c0_g1~~TRINITY_DN70244_c0_g1_i1.p1  ORF type:complete len:1036 (+),score=182.76 TRINITY_DN70244_c0_g1_i1:77-3184(+)